MTLQTGALIRVPRNTESVARSEGFASRRRYQRVPQTAWIDLVGKVTLMLYLSWLHCKCCFRWTWKLVRKKSGYTWIDLKGCFKNVFPKCLGHDFVGCLRCQEKLDGWWWVMIWCFLRRWSTVPLKIYVISSRCGGGFGGLAECGMPWNDPGDTKRMSIDFGLF